MLKFSVTQINLLLIESNIIFSINTDKVFISFYTLHKFDLAVFQALSADCVWAKTVEVLRPDSEDIFDRARSGRSAVLIFHASVTNC